MDTPSIGQIIHGDPPRDAIHFAVAPAIAGETLRPGEHIGIDKGIALKAGRGSIAIVDPFLTIVLSKGQKFWAFLYPGSITSLRHHWTHPAFADEVPAKDDAVHDMESWEWIKDYAKGLGLDYDELMQGAKDYLDSSGRDYLDKGSVFVGECLNERFWDHYENVTGNSVPERKRGNFFACSC